MNKVIIIGAGAIGLMSARQLAMAGYPVTVVERGEPGRESSWAGGGIVSPLYPWRYPDAVNQLADYSQQRYPALAMMLKETTGIDPELLESGMLLLNDPEPEIDAWSERWNHPVEYLDGATAIAAVQPGLNSDYSRATWLPDLMQLRNPRLLAALLADVGQRPQITLTAHAQVQSIALDNGRAVGVETDKGRIEGDIVLICAGAWSSGLLPESTLSARRVEPVKGQMIQFQTAPGMLARMVMRDSRYLIPRKDGLILAGSTLEHTGFEKQTDQQALEQLRDFAIDVVPALRDAPIVNHWAGLRPGTDTGIPLIGPHPEIDNLFINAGHFRNGIVIGLASVRLGIDLILGNPPIFDPEPYQIAGNH